jgi:hypothetical protein
VVARRNCLQRFHATNAASMTPMGTRNPTQPHPDALRPYLSGEIDTMNFGEFIFHALR